MPAWDEAKTDFDVRGYGSSTPGHSLWPSGTCKISRVYSRRVAFAGDWHQREHCDLQYREHAVASPAPLQGRGQTGDFVESVAGLGNHGGLVFDGAILRHQNRASRFRRRGHRHWWQRKPNRRRETGARGHDPRVFKSFTHARSGASPGPSVCFQRRRKGQRGNGNSGIWHVGQALWLGSSCAREIADDQRSSVSGDWHSAAQLFLATRSITNPGRRRTSGDPSSASACAGCTRKTGITKTTTSSAS